MKRDAQTEEAPCRGNPKARFYTMMTRPSCQRERERERMERQKPLHHQVHHTESFPGEYQGVSRTTIMCTFHSEKTKPTTRRGVLVIFGYCCTVRQGCAPLYYYCMKTVELFYHRRPRGPPATPGGVTAFHMPPCETENETGA